MDTHSENFQVVQVSQTSKEKWETSKIHHERIPYFEYEPTFEGKEDLRCSLGNELDSEYL